ncbi:hypothetical protein KEM52_005426 [Ascosphaera acerosa]|nr:hypothetical protein KEM52_005426 [Ascosphaera acerosa]
MLDFFFSGWPAEYEGRGLLNRTYFDSVDGVPDEQIRSMYRQEEKELAQGTAAGYGREGRLVTYCGTGVGLLREVHPAADIVTSVRTGALDILRGGGRAAL